MDIKTLRVWRFKRTGSLSRRRFQLFRELTGRICSANWFSSTLSWAGAFLRIASRYRLTRSQVGKIMNEWKQRAARVGYVQYIPAPEGIGHLERNEAAAFEDRRLISCLQAGNESAYAQVIDRFQNPIYNFAYRLLGNQTEAELVTEQAFLGLFRNCSSPGEDLNLRTRLYQSVMNESATRSCGRPRGHDETASTSPLERALQALHPVLRIALVLKEVEEMSYEQVDEVLEISVSAVKSRVAEARAALSREMAASNDSSTKNTPNSSVTFLYTPINNIDAIVPGP